MAEQEFKKLLLKLSISTKDWRTAVQEIRKSLEDLDREEKKKYEEKKRQVREQVVQQKATFDQQKKLQAEVTAQLNQTKLLAQQQRLLQENARTHLVEERAKTAEIQRQTAELRRQAQESRAQAGVRVAGVPGAPPGGGGILGGIAQAFAGGFGSRFTGGIAAGVLAGGGALMIVSQLGQWLGDAAEKMKQFILASGPLQQVTEQFERLAGTRGIDPSKFIKQLEEATRGLVDSMTLLRLANNFLQSGLKVSQDQVVRMTKAVTDLARAQGTDAEHALSVLNRAFLTGNFRSLAWVLGLQRATLQVKDLGEGVSNTVRRQAEFDNMLKVVEKQLDKVGAPALTFTERLKQLNIQTQNFFERAAQATLKTEGFKAVQGFFDDIIRSLETSAPLAQRVGENIGLALTSLVELGRTVSAVWSTVSTILVEALGLVRDLAVGLATLENVAFREKSGAGFLDFLIDRLSSLRGLLTTVAQMLVLVRAAVEGLGVAAEHMAKGMTAPFTSRNLEEMVRKLNHFREEAERRYSEIETEAAARIRDLGDRLRGISRTGPYQPGAIESIAAHRAKMEKKPTEEEEDANVAQRLAKLRVDLALLQAKGEVDAAKARVREEQSILEDHFKNAKIELEDYVAGVKILREEELKITLDAINKTYLAKVAALEKEKGLSREELNLRKQAFAIEATTQQDAAVIAARDATTALEQQLTADRKRAQEIGAQSEYDLRQRTLQQELRLLEQSFARGELVAKDYMARRIALWAEELRLFELNEKRKLEAAQQSDAARAASAAAVAAKQQEMQQKVAEQTREGSRIEADEIERRFQRQLAVLQAQRKATQLGGVAKFLFPLGTESEAEAIRQLILLYQNMIREFDRLRNVQDLTTAKGKQEWVDYTEKILDATSAIRNLRQEMITLPGTLATALGQLAIALGSFGGALGKGAGIFAALDTLLRRAPALGFTKPGPSLEEAGHHVLGAPGPPVPETNLFRMLGTSFKMLTGRSDQAGKGLQGFAKGVEGITGIISFAVASIGTLVQAFTGKGGTGSKMLSGLMGGATLGMAVGGPVGAAIGAVIGTALAGFFSTKNVAVGALTGFLLGGPIGAIFGGIFASKRKQTEKIAKQIKDAIQSTIKDFNEGKVKLGQAIADLERQRAAAISRLSGRKGGQKELKTILPPIDEILTQLKAQQKAVFEAFEKELPILRAPENMEQMLRSVDAIIRKYQEYVDAGGDLAKANEFLTLSYQRLQTQGLENLQESEVDAIENALRYNDLLQQRQELLDQTEQRIRDIRFAGVLTRERTRAQTIGEQISKLTEEKDKRLAQIDKEIRLVERRMTAERTVFDLAVGRIDLENRLLQLKFIEIDRDVARIRAMQQLLSTIRAGGSSLNTLDLLLRALGVLPPLAVGGGVGGDGGGLERDLLRLYEERGRRGFSGFDYERMF